MDFIVTGFPGFRFISDFQLLHGYSTANIVLQALVVHEVSVQVCFAIIFSFVVYFYGHQGLEELELFSTR